MATKYQINGTKAQGTMIVWMRYECARDTQISAVRVACGNVRQPTRTARTKKREKKNMKKKKNIEFERQR